MMEYADSHPDLVTLTLSDEEIDAYSSTIFQHIAFKKVGMFFDPQYVAYLRPADNGRPSDTIADHPIAQRTFAVMPPVDMMSVICVGGDRVDLHAIDGVTVARVLQAMPGMSVSVLFIRVLMTDLVMMGAV